MSNNGTAEKQIVHIINPNAGKGMVTRLLNDLKNEKHVYVSKSPEDTPRLIIDTCKENPHTCFTVYGGDGTVYKAINAIMESGCNDTASLKIVPIGSGNDFVRSFDSMPREFCADVMRVNHRYAINVVNMGFDCSVVERAAELKKSPLITGGMAYILGVLGELINKKPLKARVTLTYLDGTEETIDDKFLLIAVGNGKWYGGGFKVTPGARLDDGILDVTIIKDISSATFLSLVGDFRKGTHIKDADACELKAGTEEFLLYKKCKSVKVEGIVTVCCDGEIFKESTVEIGVIPRAINLVNHMEKSKTLPPPKNQNQVKKPSPVSKSLAVK
ncbi:MAG: hypothetical protein IKB27_03840 [Clostridia bacterium]|nr:hypothetical protein [Clostridia bacterium]